MPSDAARHEPDWWKRAVIYQIYPRSFQDTNADGIGDLQGIIERLDYLNDGTKKSLGVDAIWLSPMFPSPMKDFGYDVSDYEDVHPDFGDLATMDRLIAECHRRDIKVMLDWVPNHTSDQHPWFIESRSSRDNPRRDWYIWRDPAPDGGLPNNWRAAFGGPAWTLDEVTGQYYLHSFLKEQPDLNWRNPEVERAMHDTLRFWLRRGIDGFRMDVIGMILKHPELLSNPENPDWTEGSGTGRYLMVHNRNYEDVYDAIRRIRAVLDEFPGSTSVGEVFGTHQEIARYYGGDALDGLHLAFNFKFIHDTERGPEFTPWDAQVAREILLGAQAAVPPGGLPCYAFGNHDRARFISRHDADGRGRERARAAALLLLGVRSVPFLYYGEEIGMVDVDIPEDRLQDPARFRSTGRDPERTPMQWDDSPGRGFSEAQPWLPFGPKDINVAAQAEDADSLLALYRRALWTRKREASLHSGSFQLLDAPASVVAFRRDLPGANPLFVAVNMATNPVRVPVPAGFEQVICATDLALEGSSVSGELELPALGAAWVRGDSVASDASAILDR